ncbi:MAG TPA: hypothetical protein ENK25_07695 [Bacteroidetes bacterium]|nr:hypothetical protein [Bacteroidota bacterium]
MQIEVSNGEIIDKLTILEIKLEKIEDPEKRRNIEKEYLLLSKAAAGILSKDDPLYHQLKDVNMQLWDIEDRIRDLERNKNFGEEFIRTARSVYQQNDLRADLKRRINEKTGSGLMEEKSYKPY